ncbi:SulP family inorganic anion transporter [Streptomyces sp. CB03911]|uniref:SulP family inorganic anion transporter n=1 Tax=Streptomyces sp. CB03911 TaxID=1804758 RepID=UPI00093BC8F1
MARGRGSWARDATVGLTVAAVVVPAAMGMAELAGVDPVVGLWATRLPLAAYTVFGSSRQLVVGPEGTLAALTATAVAPLAVGDGDRYVLLAAALALVVGVMLIAAGTLRLGFVADFLSKPVLLGPSTAFPVGQASRHHNQCRRLLPHPLARRPRPARGFPYHRGPRRSAAGAHPAAAALWCSPAPASPIWWGRLTCAPPCARRSPPSATPMTPIDAGRGGLVS